MLLVFSIQLLFLTDRTDLHRSLSVKPFVICEIKYLKARLILPSDDLTCLHDQLFIPQTFYRVGNCRSYRPIFIAMYPLLLIKFRQAILK